MALSFPEFVELARAFQESRLVLTAIELDVFRAAGEGARAGDVAALLGTDSRATEALLNALTASGAMTKEGDVFRNTPELAPFLAGGGESEARKALLHTVNLWRTWSTLTECVRAGKAVLPPGVEANDPDWRESFLAAMHRNAQVFAAEMVRRVDASRARRLLDIGGGSGACAMAFARAHPGLDAEVLDLEAVLPITRRYIEQAGLSGRVRTRAGDLRADEFGSGYDLILLSAICHMLDPAENRDLLARCRRALAAGGRLVVRDFILDAGKTSPKPAALFALNMLVATRGGSSYSEDEYRAWLAEAGFARVERPDPRGDLLVATA